MPPISIVPAAAVISIIAAFAYFKMQDRTFTLTALVALLFFMVGIHFANGLLANEPTPAPGGLSIIPTGYAALQSNVAIAIVVFYLFIAIVRMNSLQKQRARRRRRRQ